MLTTYRQHDRLLVKNMHGHLGSLVKRDVASSGCNQIHKGYPRDVQHNAAILLMPQCKVENVDKKHQKNEL